MLASILRLHAHSLILPSPWYSYFLPGNLITVIRAFTGCPRAYDSSGDPEFSRLQSRGPLKQANQRLNALIAIQRIRQVNLMSGSAQSMSFQDLVDAVETMPLDDQAMLVNLINKRIQEKRRAKLLAEVQEARDAFSRGEVKRGSFEDLMKDLKA
jgi:hypothetical protein